VVFDHRPGGICQDDPPAVVKRAALPPPGARLSAGEQSPIIKSKGGVVITASGQHQDGHDYACDDEEDKNERE
jgi:hypothetical protein